MPIRLRLADMLAERGLTGREVARRVGLSETQLSMLRSGRVRGLRFDTLARLCAVLDCAPGDLLAYDFDESDLEPKPERER